ncbi:E3 ubiquitin- ligase synoviolin isoform X2 [Brachionus plicatilis]|uniref:RING-type E3 ubiquitin transferase n=1 Tax=Brachionus plicatilis TaxID=10195 RepID=A0A3M7RV05_BRAPC|nr:E3 ubiquitin- ligase synoviolin isoform X2 [Brachionus plicatilis]
MARFRSELGILVSFVLTTSVIINAFSHKKQFYPSIVYLTKSNSSMAIIYLQAFVLTLLIGKLMNRIFFGELRAIELEHLFERSWYAITETCLAFTVFRDDFSPKFVTMFTLLLFLKCFHWLTEDRVEYMERSPNITVMFHARILGLMILLSVLDLNFVNVAYQHTVAKGASVQLVFGFEYAILFINMLSTMTKYLLHTVDLQNENPWENKGIYILHSELVLGFIRVFLYLTFMSIMIKIHTFPLFAIRPMYLALRSFKKSLNDVVQSRRAIRNLNIMYPDVTPEQLRNYSDTICIICREEMANPNEGPQQIKKLPCDHIFHKNCLRSWFQRQQTCPTCRTSILRFNNQPAQPAQANFAQAHQAPAQQQAEPPQPPNINAQPNPNVPFMPDFPTPFAPLGMFNAPMPPFAFMPPPLPPLNLASLSTEELDTMEGQERHNVEARIHCLRNISVLLNSSMVQMQQYMNMCAATSHLENLTGKKSRVENDLNLVNSQEESLSQVKQEMSEEKNVFENLAGSSDQTAASTSKQSENDEIRRRRLEKLES